MTPEPLGRSLEELCGEAREQLVLCAPFAKAAVVRRLLEQLPRADVDVLVITRWRPEEVAQGVSDVGVFSEVKRVGGRVVLHDQLHAKYFRTAGLVLIGSANLTGRALGWTWPSNVELLAPASEAVVLPLERRLLREGVLADDDVAEDVQRRADLLGLAPRPAEVLISGVSGPWFPVLRYPQDLFEAYRHGPWALSRQSGEDAVRDLLLLGLVPNLSRPDFASAVCHAVWSSEVFEAVKPQLVYPTRFGAITHTLQTRFDIDRDVAQTVWQTLMRWLLVFCPDRVELRVAGWSEVLVLRRGRQD